MNALLPELLLAVGIVLAMLAGATPALRAKRTPLWIALLAAGAALVATCFPARGVAADMLAVDPVAHVARGVCAGLLVLLLLGTAGERRSARDDDAFATCLLGVGLGALLVAAAANLVTLWIGLELVSLGSYALAAWRGGDRRAAEAGTKYVLFGSAASGLTLFGASHVYGLTGCLDFVGIGQALGTGMPVATAAALALAAVGIAYKLTLVPFHFYAPDVYEGAPPLSVAVVSTLPKVAATAALVRALTTMLPPPVAAGNAGAVLAAAAICSLGVSAFTSLVQRDARRIVAFSGIGHGGTIVLALAALPGALPGVQSAGSAAALTFVLAYAAAALGALMCLSVLERDAGSTSLDALRGAIRTRPWVTAALCLFLASLAGIPPLAGFLGKWVVLQQALGGGPWQLAGGMALLATTAIFAWAYLLIVRATVLAAPATDRPAAAAAAPPPPVPAATAAVLIACAVATVGLGVWLDVVPAVAAFVQQ